MSIKTSDLEKLTKYLGRETYEEEGQTEAGLSNLITELISALDRKQQVIEKCAEAISDLEATNKRLASKHSLRDSTLLEVQKTLGDFNIQKNLNQGLIFEDDIMDRLLNHKNTLDKYTKIQLRNINCRFKDNDSLESVMYQLICMVGARDLTITKHEKTIKGINYRLEEGLEAVKLIEKNFPGIFDIQDEDLVVQQGGVPFDCAVDSLIKRCHELENKTPEAEINEMDDEAKIIYLKKQGHKASEIVRMTGIGKNRVYRIFNEN